VLRNSCEDPRFDPLFLRRLRAMRIPARIGDRRRADYSDSVSPLGVEQTIALDRAIRLATVAERLNDDGRLRPDQHRHDHVHQYGLSWSR